MNEYYIFTCRFCKVPLRREHYHPYPLCLSLAHFLLLEVQEKEMPGGPVRSDPVDDNMRGGEYY